MKTIDVDLGGQKAVLSPSGLTLDGVKVAPGDQMPHDPDTPDWIRELPDQQTVAAAVAAKVVKMFDAAMEPAEGVERRISAWRDEHGAWSPGDEEPPLEIVRGRVANAALWAQAAMLCLWAGSDPAAVEGVEVHEERDQLHGIFEGAWVVGGRIGPRLEYFRLSAREEAEQVAAALADLLEVGWRVVEWQLTPVELPANLAGEAMQWDSYRLDVTGGRSAELLHCPTSRAAVIRCAGQVVSTTATTPAKAVQYFLRGQMED